MLDSRPPAAADVLEAEDRDAGHRSVERGVKSDTPKEAKS